MQLFIAKSQTYDISLLSSMYYAVCKHTIQRLKSSFKLHGIQQQQMTPLVGCILSWNYTFSESWNYIFLLSIYYSVSAALSQCPVDILQMLRYNYITTLIIGFYMNNYIASCLLCASAHDVTELNELKVINSCIVCHCMYRKFTCMHVDIIQNLMWLCV